MNKIFEYLNLIPKGIKNADSILFGIVNDLKLENNSLPIDEKEEIIKRRFICKTCPFNSVNAQHSVEYKELYNESYKTDRDDLHCSICLCNIKWKTANFKEKCGLSYYNDLNPSNQKELFWKEYKK